MKNIIRLFAIGAVAFTGVSCEDFLSADPVNRVSAEAFFVSESDLQLYCNGLLESYCPSANTIGMGDSYTDLPPANRVRIITNRGQHGMQVSRPVGMSVIGEVSVVPILCCGTWFVPKRMFQRSFIIIMKA